MVCPQAPSLGTVLPLPQTGSPAPHCPPPKGLGGTGWDRVTALGGKETDVSIPGHRLLLLSWGPLPHLLPHFPFFLPSPHPQWFFCVNCAIFILFPFFPFSQRNKGLEIAGFLVLVTSMENRLHTRVSALIPGEALFTGCGISLGGTAGLQGRGSTSVAGQQSPVACFTSADIG